MPIRFTNRVLAHLRDRRYEPVSVDALAVQVGVEEDERADFDQAIATLKSDSRIDLSGNVVQLPAIGRDIVGKIRVHPKGFAFVIPNEPNREGDLFIPYGESWGAVSGDIVRASVRQARERRRHGKVPSGKSPYIGIVEEILERAKTQYVGTLIKHNQFWLVEPDGRQLPDMVRVRDVSAKNAKEGDKVVVEIVQYPEVGDWGEGVIVERLGEAGIPSVETEAVIRTYDLPGPFPEECLEHARSLAQGFDHIEDELVNREDLREEFIITIDPPDARDFDDAISIRRLKNGGYELGVHIADVSYFVGPGTPLDLEAKERGNSVYLPRHVIPMLPEVLSNGVCSLQEGVDRLTRSAIMQYDADGHVQNARFCASIIRSAKRLTYLEAEALIKGDAKTAKENAISETDYPETLIETVRLLSELAGVIRERRLKDGMIVLTLPDVQLVFDDHGHVTGAVPEDDASTHGIIEMFMVEANEAVASLFDSLRVPLLRRTHPDPSTFDLGELRTFCRVAGINIPKNPSRFELQNILEWTRGTPRQQAVHMAVLKSLTKAEYSPAIIGHFALASSHYAHFTSPIRRYPDLLVHRALTAFLEQTTNGRSKPKGKGMKRLGRTLMDDDRCLDEEALIDVGRNCNETERSAEMAERSLRKFLVLQYLAEHLEGETVEALVTGVTNNVIFLQLTDYLVEGGLEVREMAEVMTPGKSRNSRAERWQINPSTGALTAQKSGHSINIGDTMTVLVKRIDPAARRLEFAPLPQKPKKRKLKQEKEKGPDPDKGSNKGPKGKGPKKRRR